MSCQERNCQERDRKYWEWQNRTCQCNILQVSNLHDMNWQDRNWQNRNREYKHWQTIHVSRKRPGRNNINQTGKLETGMTGKLIPQTRKKGSVGEVSDKLKLYTI